MRLFRRLSALNASEAEAIKRFCSAYLEPSPRSQALNAAYILGDLEYAADKFEIAFAEPSSPIQALLLRCSPIYAPLGLQIPALELMADLMDMDHYFVRVPAEWATDFRREFAYASDLHQQVFWLNDPAGFRPQTASPDLEIRSARSAADLYALAAYYEVQADELLETAHSHTRILGLCGDTLVSVARANVVSEKYAVLGGVHTRKMFRGRGYAKAVCSLWTQEILRQGRIPLLETDVDNHPALAIYRALGYQVIGESWFFEKGTTIIERLRSRA